MAGEEALDPLIGARVGPCRIEQRLAAGGMGVVYRALHVQMGHDVAVKILAPSLAQDQEYVTRFFREAGAAGQIDHPNVVRVIDVGKFDDRYYLVMEFVPGDTLDAVLERERKLPLDRATRVIREIAAGLAAAHRSGIVHRDVKPGNILMAPDGKPHLTDFGLARHAETRKGLTIEGTFLGTPEYASPEQVEGKKVDHRTDLYSLGCTYYQLLSGTLPFLGESPMEIAIKRAKEDPRPLENASPGMDPRACTIVNRLIEREPGKRYASCTDLIRDLDKILSGEKPTTVKSESTKVKSAASMAASRRRVRAFLHWDLLCTSLLIAFLAGGLAARGGAFIETVLAGDADLGLRLLLAGIAAIGAGGAIFLYTRELRSKGRIAGVVGVVAVMFLGAVATGTLIDRSEGAGALATMAGTLRALLEHATEPVNRVAGGLLLLFGAAMVGFERQPGSGRVLACRILAAGAFLLWFAFGLGSTSVLAPFRSLTSQAELGVPLATASLLAAGFGALLLGGFGFEALSRTFGLVLCLGACAGFFAFAVLMPQAARPEGWLTLLGEPFHDLGRGFVRSGGPLAVVAALGFVERWIVVDGLRQQERVVRRR
ncbi:MAG TPA: serine/threonine-protein kinase [Planctomycetota bacterium]